MPRDPDTLREEARRDRERAAELADSNPSASDYYELRAAWRERLARDEDAAREDR